MDDLPPSLVLEILNRLSDSADLARCRVASKSLNVLSREVRSVNLFCSLDRYLKSRAVETRLLVMPFKVILKSLMNDFVALDSVSIGVEKSLGRISYEHDDVEDWSDDLFLTDVGFAREWLPAIGRGLTSLSIVDFWVQSCWRQSKILALITLCCGNLQELELKNAWLSVDGLNRLNSLKCLTLEFIRLDDEDLSEVNYNFPHLEILNLIGVGGLNEPKIHLSQLKTCRWTVSNAPVSLSICAPSLSKLELKCVKPKSLIIQTPMVSDFHFCLQDASGLQVNEFPCLRKLQLHFPCLYSLITTFSSARTIKELTLNTMQRAESVESVKLCLDTLFEIFPNLSFLKLGPGVFSEAETCYQAEGLDGRIGMRDLKKIHASLETYKIELKLPFIIPILEKCTDSLGMELLIYHNADSHLAGGIMSKRAVNHPRPKWRWELWKEGLKEPWAKGI
ncbi:F-box/LRR-repeat protein At4g29420 [Cucurbita maxima]|uniref:F-box/LRR-repeat protein At4g29420 n=1 Tax=Cucurbita maxima TaxID=3661 RepID=A0A6J1HNV0_CUCMA|nr:F-box/LRR-repeat protein At4g29420 [Cucurbita maxima]XP_022966762.1 F-box/LRR-repeat protein At4g29420 [Cucurbita maxima]